MRNDNRRVTLVARHTGNSSRDWDFSHPLGSRLVFVDSPSFLPLAIESGFELGQDIERVIVDRSGSADQLLQLIASLPQEFVGDILFISDSGRGFLSAPGRGDGRILYSLSERDVDFYLQTSNLLWTSFPGEIRVSQVAVA